jgi:hypothetical protein
MTVAANLVLLAAAFLAACAGGIALALCQARNWRAVTGERDLGAIARLARVIGWCLVFASLAFCVVRDGWSFAALLWPLLLGAAAAFIALTLAFRPQWMKPFAVALAALSSGRVGIGAAGKTQID